MQNSLAAADQITLFYQDVRAMTSGAITMTNIKQKNMAYQLTASVADCRKIIVLLKKSDFKGTINNQFIRLCLPASSEWPEYFLDQDGRVFDGTSEYVLEPYAFLKVVDYMDYLKGKNKIKEAGWTNRKYP